MASAFRSLVSLLVYDTTLSPGRCLLGKHPTTSILVAVVLPILTRNNTVLLSYVSDVSISPSRFIISVLIWLVWGGHLIPFSVFVGRGLNTGFH